MVIENNGSIIIGTTPSPNYQQQQQQKKYPRPSKNQMLETQG